LAVLAIALCGCQTGSYVGNENSPYYVVPPGSRLILERELTIPADALATYIQNGRVLSNNEVQRLYPFCKFDLARLAPHPRTVQPDEIVVIRTVQEISYGASAQAERIYAAGFGFGGLFNLDGPSMQTFSTRMDLRSEKQPDIFRLTCAQWGERGIDRHVTISEIRRTLAGVFTLRLPHEIT
jgi:hypothetical protein